jgi:imidazolonepropionase-like amidohydrolase
MNKATFKPHDGFFRRSPAKTASVAHVSALQLFLELFMKRLLSSLGLLVASCTHTAEPKKQTLPTMSSPIVGADAKNLAIIGGKLKMSDGSFAVKNLHITNGKITAIDDKPAASDEKAFDAKGSFLVPGFIDSHVHITFSTPEFELQGGILAAVDMGAPVAIWEDAPKMLPFHLYPVGQLLTAVGGYPTQGWGSNGYGREIRGVEDAKAAAQEVIKRGAKIVKMPLDPSGPLLSAAEQKAIVETAHAAKLPVGSHALTADVVQMALDAGVDVLVHAPIEKLSDDLIKKFCARPKAAVITTFEAFGVSRGALENVKRLKAAGCKVMYGSDLGNGVSSGILMGEIEDMTSIGMTPTEIIDAATKTPAEYFGLDGLGEISVGKIASFLVIEGDPYQDITKLETRKAIFADGLEIKQ